MSNEATEYIHKLERDRHVIDTLPKGARNGLLRLMTEFTPAITVGLDASDLPCKKH